MKRRVAAFVVCFACWLLAVLSGCAASRPLWTAGISWRDLSCDSLTELHRAGFDCIEVALDDLMKLPPIARPDRCSQILANARKAHITIWSVHVPFGKTWDISATDPQARANAMSNVLQAIELCRLLQPRKAVIHASAEPIRDDERPARLRAAREALTQLAPEFAAIHVQLAVEDLPRTCLGNTSAEVLWLIRDLDELGVCFDTNHLLKETHEDFVRNVGSRIVTLHVADYDGKDERHWMPGEGIIRWQALAESLMRAGYGGPFLYETGKHKNGRPIQPPELIRFLGDLRSSG